MIKQLRTRFRNWQYRQRVAAFLQYTKANPLAGFQLASGEEGRALSWPTDPNVTTDVQKNEVWAYVAMNVLGKNLSAAPLIVEEQKTVGGEMVWQQTDTGDLAELVIHPNPLEPMDVLLWKLVLSLLSIGDAYLIRDPIANEIYFVHPSRVKVQPDSDGNVERYVITRGAKQTSVGPDVMVHLKMPNHNHAFYGQAPLEPARVGILQNFFYRRYLKNFFKNGAIPRGLLVSEQQLGQNVAAETRKEWNKFHQGVDDSHMIGVLGQGLTYQDISPSLGDLVSEALYNLPRNEILAIFSVPPVFANVFEFANYANTKEQKQFLWENAILPLHRIIKGYLNIQLTPQYGERLRLNFDISKINALKEDETALYKRQIDAHKGGLITANEGREKIGLLPVENGDELLKAPGEQDDDKAMFGPLIQRDLNPKYVEWERHYKAVLFTERQFASLMRKFFDDQLDRILKELDRISLFKGKQLSKTHLWMFNNNIKGPEGDSILIFDIDVENLLLQEVTDPVIRAMISESAKRAMRRVGFATAFDVENPAIQNMTAQFFNRIKDINDATFAEIQKVLTKAFDESLGLKETEKLLRTQFQMFDKVRAGRIAKTEVNGLVSGGAKLGYSEAGVKQTMWVSAFLSTTRQTHADADGQVRYIGDAFDVGGEALHFPSDPNGSAENTINCYCGIQPVVE